MALTWPEAGGCLAGNAAPRAMISIQVKQLTKHFGPVVALHGLDLTIDQGELFFLLGPSGCGKTTLLRCLAGFYVPEQGRILFGEEDVTRLEPHRRNTGMMFQSYALWPHMTVAENVAFGLEERKVPRDEIRPRVAQALAAVHMGQLADRRPNQLSGGQQQRIALARALVFEPELVLMDEPLGALDKQLREHMQFEIKHLHERLGVTVVYVTHDQSEALTMSDRIAVFNDGRIQQLARPEDLYERPTNSFVAQFIGENNTLRGTVETMGADRCTVRLGDGSLIDALPVNVAKPGDATLVSIRPERVEFRSERMPADVHRIRAEVLEFIYMGDSFRTRLRVADNDNFIMKCRNAVGQQRLAPGQTIEIGWHVPDCRALDAA